MVARRRGQLYDDRAKKEAQLTQVTGARRRQTQSRRVLTSSHHPSDPASPPPHSHTGAGRQGPTNGGPGGGGACAPSRAGTPPPPPFNTLITLTLALTLTEALRARRLEQAHACERKQRALDRKFVALQRQQRELDEAKEVHSDRSVACN